MRQPRYDESIPSAARLGMEVVSVGKIIRRHLSREAALIGLSDGEWGILTHLRRCGENISQKDLAWRLGNEAHAVVRVLVNLEEAGRVKRVVDPDDARGRLVSLTHRGRVLADRFLRVVDAFEQNVIGNLRDDEMRCLMSVFGRIRERLADDEA